MVKLPEQDFVLYGAGPQCASPPPPTPTTHTQPSPLQTLLPSLRLFQQESYSQSLVLIVGSEDGTRTSWEVGSPGCLPGAIFYLGAALRPCSLLSSKSYLLNRSCRSGRQVFLILPLPSHVWKHWNQFLKRAEAQERAYPTTLNSSNQIQLSKKTLILFGDECCCLKWKLYQKTVA